MNLYDVVEQKRNQILRESVTSDEFMDFMKKNMEPYETLLTYYRCAIMEVETKFNVLNEQFSLQYDRNPIESVKSRLKSTQSLIKKIRKKNIPLTVESIEKNITDITLIEKKDYIENPKPSGYRSLHLIVEVPIFLENEKRNMKVEVQLRTIAMDFWASVEHKLRYKKNIPADQAETLGAELVECADISAALDFRMQDIRKRLAQAELENEPQPTELHRRMGAQLRKQPVLTALQTDLQNLREKNLKRVNRFREGKS